MAADRWSTTGAADQATACPEVQRSAGAGGRGGQWRCLVGAEAQHRSGRYAAHWCVVLVQAAAAAISNGTCVIKDRLLIYVGCVGRDGRHPPFVGYRLRSC